MNDGREALEQEVEALLHDDIIVGMAGELTARCITRKLDPIRVINTDYERFRDAAYATYRERGGTADVSLGSPALAIAVTTKIMRGLAKTILRDALSGMMDDIDNWAESTEEDDE